MLGCSSSSTAPRNGLSDSQANAIVDNLTIGFLNGIAGVHPSSPVLVQPVAMPLVNVPLQQRTSCEAGGYIAVAGSITGSIDDSTGTGTLFLSVVESIIQCGIGSSVVINGAPYISIAGHVPFLSWVQSTAASFEFGGGFSWGTGATQTCSIRLTALINPDHHGRTSGTLCDVTVNRTF